MAKCEYICLSAEEMEKLKKDCDSASKTTKKKKTTKTTKKKAKTPQKVRKTTKKKVKTPQKVRKTTKKTAAPSKRVTKKKKIVNKNKNRNSNRNVNTNNVSVSVRSNPKAVSNIYIVRPEPQTIIESPRRKQSVPYDAPFLPRRTADGGLIQPPSAPRTRTVYVQSQTVPEIVVERGSRSGSLKKAGRGVINAGRSVVSRARRNRTEYDVDYPTAIESPRSTTEVLPAGKSSTKALPPPKKEIIVDADYEIVND